MAFFDDLKNQYGFGVDQSDQDAYNQGRLSEDEIRRRMASRGAPTASAGGSGGDADVDGNGQVDAGWTTRAGDRGEFTLVRSGQGGGGGAMANQSPAAQWNAQPSAPAAQVPATDPRRDALYAELLKRAQQGTAVDRNDPIIRAQSDAFAANQTRAARNILSDRAEAAGPYGNPAGDRRMVTERLGQATGQFEAELMGRELSARRGEIQDALDSMGSFLSADQQVALQRELAQLDAALRQQGFGIQRELGLGDLDLRRSSLDLQRRDQDMGMDRFLRELALREWELGDSSDFRWASL